MNQPAKPASEAVDDPYGINLIRYSPYRTPERNERLARFVEEHIARGNEPDYERGREALDRMDAYIAEHGPIEMTDEEEEAIIAASFRRNRR